MFIPTRPALVGQLLVCLAPLHVGAWSLISTATPSCVPPLTLLRWSSYFFAAHISNGLRIVEDAAASADHGRPWPTPFSTPTVTPINRAAFRDG